MKKMLFLLLALVIVPVWAANAVPAASGAPSVQAAQPAQKHTTRKHKKKKTAKKAEASTESISPLACTKQTCYGTSGCYQTKCGTACTGC